MKYIKRFENIGNKFKVGDIVVVNSQFRARNFKEDFVYNYDFLDFIEKSPVKIFKIKDKMFFVDYNLYDKTVDEDGISYYLFLYEDELRFATPEEVEQYEIDTNINKYNL